MLDSKPLLFPSDFPVLNRRSISTLQVNLGFYCNQSCQHCHVNAGPSRKEIMSRETVDAVLEFLLHAQIGTLDLTGGAPELNPDFRYLVERAVAHGIAVIDRCNLTVLNEPGQSDLAAFLAEHKVRVVASLPCYLEDNVDRQRGKGVFDSSLEALKKLNDLGYGKPGSKLELDLVYNPAGASLPPPQQQLEEDYRKQLQQRFDVFFNQLLTITNMPIQRFGSLLQSQGLFSSYLDLLKDAFRHENLETVMCRELLSVDWRGYVYDCDFNQMLDLPLLHDDTSGGAVHISNLDKDMLPGAVIQIADHCYGCTAGQGSSCGGALS